MSKGLERMKVALREAADEYSGPHGDTEYWAFVAGAGWMAQNLETMVHRGTKASETLAYQVHKTED